MRKPGDHPLRGLLVAQFLGAFNDNAWKMVVTLLGIRAIQLQAPAGESVEAAVQSQTFYAFLALTLPLMVFSIPAGILADRLSKRAVIIGMKTLEIALMAAGTLCLAFAPANQGLLLIVLAGMGLQSALFSPAKYGILPEVLTHDRLSRGNGLLEMWSFIAIILGTGLAGFALESSGAHPWAVGAMLTVLSVAGWRASLAVPRVEPAGSGTGIVDAFAGSWRAVRGERVLWLSVLGMAFFWTVAALVGHEILVYGKHTLALGDDQAPLPLAVFSIGIGAGAVLAGRLSSGKVEYGLIPLGALGLAVFLIALGLSQPGFVGAMVFMVPLGLFSGFIVVPLNAVLQWRAPPERRGGVIAMANVLAFGGMIVGTFTASQMAYVGVGAAQGIVVAGALTVIGTAWALWLLPTAFLRFVLIVLTHTFYRLRVVGRANVPEEGGALLVPNHVSFADALFLMASVDRPIRFIVDAHYFEKPLYKPFLRSLEAIPISAAGGPRTVLKAMRDAGESLDEGHLVCIFAEGQITRIGALLPFRRGLERIAKGRDVPVIPVHLAGVWGSVFSHSRGRFLVKMPERIPYPVTVVYGESVSARTRASEVRRCVQDLGATAWTEWQVGRAPLHHSFVRRCRRRPLDLLFADSTRPKLSRLGALTGAVALARALRPSWRGQENVGFLLPPSVAGALANLAAPLAGRVAVNINFTAGRAAIESAIKQSGLRTVLTSRAFLEKFPVQLPADVERIWIEDLAAQIGRFDRLSALLLGLLAPLRMLERFCGAERAVRTSDVATVIFSSGSTGEPKGVLLTHGSIDANVEAVAQVTRAGRGDRLLGVLPLFHSFGNLALWFAANRDLASVFHPNPLDSAAVGDLVQRYRLTVLIATPTFLQIYLRRCTPEQFGSLRLVIVGAEKLSERLANAFEEKFGVRPLEGYGTTECSPVIATGVPDFRAPGFYQSGSRRGSVGQPLPGVALKIVDPDTFEPLPASDAGLILVRGPNLMKGYLNHPELTVEVFRDGWYVTGDIGRLDEEGFLWITDRVSRFAKIGGEMVPHGTVELALQEVAGETTSVFAVTSVPDEKKGERLVVLYTVDEKRIPEIVAKLSDCGLPNLFIPKADQFLKIEELPLLGTGKLDLRAVKRAALEAFTSSTQQ